MFGRKRHVAEESLPSAPRPSEERLFELVHHHLAALIGERGAWTVSRRDVDEDALFHGMLAHSAAAQITAAIAAEYGTSAAADAVAQVPREEEPVKRWAPAPITMFADLRKPVTGEIPRIAAGSRDERDTLVA